jgi:hypothetical protein
MNRRISTLIAVGAAFAWAGAALGWGARGHRLIACLALDGLPADAPAFLRDPGTRDLIAEEANEPDKWRGITAPALAHANGPDHYLDVEDLEQFGLTLDTVPELRQEYFRVLAISKHIHPEEITQPYDAKDDGDKTKEWPGFLPHAISEHYQKLRSSFNTLRILEALDDPARATQLELARRNVVTEMGMLAHFVGDAAQPLHTTRHHHGWVGPNPAGYTTDHGIHAYIDSAIIDLHGYTYESLKASVNFDRTINQADPWSDVIAHIHRSFEHVEPLYALQHEKALDGEAGKAFIAERLTDGAGMLGALYKAAWESVPTDQQVASWVKYNSVDGKTPPQRHRTPQSPNGDGTSAGGPEPKQVPPGGR